jgi:hypothetical protein
MEEEQLEQPVMNHLFIPLPSKPTALADELNQYLAQFGNNPNGPYVYPRVVRSKDGSHKENWTGHIPDLENRDVVQDFYKSPKGGKSC